MYRQNGLITGLSNTNDLWSAYFGHGGSSSSSTACRTYDTTDSTVIEYDLPGVKESDLEITLQNKYIHVSATRAARDGQKVFNKSFDLTDVADPDRITARLADGVLTITVPKRASAQPRKIALSH